MKLQHLKIAFLLMFTLAVTTLFASAQSFTLGNLSYSYNDTGLTITDYNESATGSVAIPSSLTVPSPTNSAVLVTLPVTRIDSGAFYNCTGITSITVPNSVTSIGTAFKGCTSLEKITIPFIGSSRTSTEHAAVFGYIFGYTFTKEDNTTFQYSDGYNNYYYYIPESLREVTITDVTTIPANAFKSCVNLAKITIPNTVTSIGGYGFANCVNVTDLAIPQGVTSIGEHAFDNCTSVSNLTVPQGLKRIEDSAFKGCAKASNLTIPDGVTYIGNYSFTNCTSATNLDIPTSATFIGYYAFQNCPLPSEVIVPDSVTEIRDGVFRGCNTIEKITLPFVGTSTSATDYRSVFGCIFGASNTAEDGMTHQGNMYYYIPESLREVTITSATTIPANAFRNCSNLTKIALPDTVTSIGHYAFYNCSSATNLTIPQGVTRIETSAFENCTSASNLTIPDGVTYIGIRAFYKANLPAELVIPNSVTSIGDIAFYGCNIEKLTLPFVGNSRTSSNGQFGRIFGDGSKADGMTQQGSSYYFIPQSLREVTITDATKIPANAFENCVNLTKISLPSTLTSIGNYAFYNCKNVTDLALPDTVTSIGSYAFNNCISVTNLTIPQGVTRIETSAFENCTSASNLTIPDGVTYIGIRAFYKANLPAELVIPNSVISIGDIAFYGCNIEKLTLPFVGNSRTSTGSTGLFGRIFGDGSKADGMTQQGSSYYFIPQSLREVTITDATEIPANAFENCVNLTKISLPSTLTSIGNYAFYNCKNVTDLALPESVTSIGSYAFNNCISVTNLTIPQGVTRIETSAFENCTSASDLTIPDGVTYIGYRAFYNANLPAELIIPNSVTSIGDTAFYGCNIEKLTLPFVGNSRTSSNGQFGYIFGSGSKADGMTLQGSSYYYIPQSLREVTIIDATKIPANAFENCVNLTKISLPSTLTSIDYHAFSNCTGLESVYYDGSKAAWDKVSVNLTGNDILLQKLVTAKSFTKTEVDETGTIFTVNLTNIESGSTVILALFDGFKFVEMQHATYAGEALTFTTDKAYTDAKVMVWDSLTNAAPVCESEIVE